MFVSSYNTYIDTGTAKKVQDPRETHANKKPSETFESKLLQTTDKNLLITGNKLPVDYISNYKSLNNRQKLQQQSLMQDTTQLKYTKISSMSKAQNAYSENSQMFSLIQKPKHPIGTTPALTTKSADEQDEPQADIFKTKMINTYISNDNYYRITAA